MALAGPFDGVIETSGTKLDFAVTASDTVAPASGLVPHHLQLEDPRQCSIDAGEFLWVRGPSNSVFVYTPVG